MTTEEVPEVYNLETIEQMRAIADPLRQRIMQELLQQPRTVTQVAEVLGIAPAKVHYHVRELERVGLTSTMRLSRPPPLRNLRAFCVAARHRSFKFAADERFLTPSAVSHQMKELEDSLGVRLFARKTRALASPSRRNVSTT